jgi:hypothetical protein
MKPAAFELTESGGLTEVDAADARRRWRAGEGAFWIDVKECSKDELEAMLDELELSELLKRRLLRLGKGTSIIALRDVTFAEWAMFADEACSRRAHVAALCLQNLLVTLQSEPVEAPTDTRQACFARFCSGRVQEPRAGCTRFGISCWSSTGAWMKTQAACRLPSSHS